MAGLCVMMCRRNDMQHRAWVGMMGFQHERHDERVVGSFIAGASHGGPRARRREGGLGCMTHRLP